MQVKCVQKRRFDLHTADGKVESWDVVDSWNDFIELRHGDEKIIAVDPAKGVLSVFDQLTNDQKPKSMHIISASPSVLERFNVAT